MLIEFKVANYRSFREQQTLSFVASNADKGVLPENLIDLSLPGMSGLSYLKSVVLFGPNASGKTNLLQALWHLIEFVARSTPDRSSEDSTFAEPFKLSSEYVRKPSVFELTFVADGIRYLLGLSLTKKRIIEEYLVAYPKGLPQKWYHRRWNEANHEYEWEFKSSAFKKGRAPIEKLTRHNATFISTGSLFEHKQLNSIFRWFDYNIAYTEMGDEPIDAMAINRLIGEKNELTGKKYPPPLNKDDILPFLQAADLGITDFQVDKKMVRKDNPNKYEPVVMVMDENTGDFLGYQQHFLSFTHKATEKGIIFKPAEESKGTLSYFSLLGLCLSSIKSSQLVLVDELDARLHPQLSQAVIRRFNKQSTTSQLVFTTHNPFLLDSGVMRRDQVWFTEKDKSGASKIFPLTDFSPRKDEARVKAYLSGRYGAVPFLDEVLTK